MLELAATIKNHAGIHCRPSAVIVKALQQYAGTVEVRAESGTCDPRSIMGMLSLGLQHGAKVTVRVDGPDEEAVCHRLAALLETEFDFPPRQEGDPVLNPADLEATVGPPGEEVPGPVSSA